MDQDAKIAMHGHCHCGAVQITVFAKPDFLNNCNCSLCASNGTVWAYLSPDDVQVTGETHTYHRANYPNPAVDIHFCPQCGNCTHWMSRLIEYAGTMGTNMRLFAAADLEGIELRFPDGRNWFGEGDYGYRKPSEILTAENDVGLW